MTRSAKQWVRDTRGLRANAQRKAAVTEQRAEAALALLIQEQRLITFKAVAQTAGISTAWLYEHDPRDAQRDISKQAEKWEYVPLTCRRNAGRRG